LTDEEFKHVALAKNIVSGDVFQLVLSRRFTRLQRRRVQCVQSVEKHQPFPYLFFLIMGFKIFGSSPEAQIIVKTKPKSILLQELLKEQVMMKRQY
jgi:anthranilate synthase component 1